ncbi:single-stranded DNA-binding protein [Lysinibacillus fusiformis]|nr:single-stranded DNA-binding protein [Lysinibacillus fusiformis]
MINRTVLVGRLTKDPELCYTPNGIASCRFMVAVNRTFSNQQGEKEADFISCQAWRKQAENLANFMRKGNLIGVEGRIQTGSYEGQNGQRVYTTDVVADSVQFLEPRSNPQQQGGSQSQQSYNNQPSYGSGQPQQQYSGQNAQYNQQHSQFKWPSQQQNQPPMNQPNYTRVDEDPFANSRGPIEVSEDDLPF